ncbi:3-keto-disaccharide hydrolase [Candidatus Laterigemmans baculatus]|uniref:3-keto-disaccharide hydrolase n=1 Tax=Candidatus Laterigemmans baculatus TaxID=2770505 RepID=UPI0036F1DE7A
MRTLPFFLLSLTASGVLGGFAADSAVAAEAADQSQELPQLFDGKSLQGWHGRPHMDPAKYAETTEEQRAQWEKETAEHWTVENGELVNDGKGPYLTTNKEYGDYELRLEYRTVAGADSGIYLRGVPQVQIWDTTDESKFKLGANLGSGALWNNPPGAPGKDPLVKADRPFGEWNSVRIVHVGERVSVWLNDKLVVDHARMDNYWDRDAPLPAKGPIQLQTHGGEIRWRNIGLRELSAEEANEILSSHGDKGFKSIFDGESLAGWAGAVDDYQVQDGAIVCRPGRGGNLFTEEVYGDFVARLEFKLPPGGNNGLAIRYPGKGGPSVDGMTELQVIDNTAEKYAELDPRQYHGSAYGMAAAKRGYLRPIGEWNFQEVTVRGSTIVVELNGTVILDTDLSKIEEFMQKTPPPGRTRTEGHFGFAGHSDPVQFRALEIKKLD